MLFNTLQFAIFFCAVLAVFRCVPRSARTMWLLGASLLFYLLWYPMYLLLLLLDIGVNYLLVRALASSRRPRLVLATSVSFTLGLLAYFKYAAFFVESAAPLLAAGFGWSPPVPEIVLPLGISFYSFQIIGLAIDTYRGHGPPVPNLGRYALFVSFFPQLIAGPILRGDELLPQIESGGTITPERTRRGIWLIASGLTKKVIFADFLLAPFVDEVFAVPGVGSAPFHWAAAYSFAFQIYFDFSGYTDMARGLACLLGYELPLNFREPYLSRNPAEFWHRWHVTLSRWLRDYLYIPLGGNRGGPIRTYVNLALTMLLGGLWHGAAWNFVVWGGLHGVMLACHRRFRRTDAETAPLRPGDVPRIFLMFHAATLLFVFFRASTFPGALTFIEALVAGGKHHGWPVLQMLVLLVCANLHWLERAARLHIVAVRERLATTWWGIALEGCALGSVVGLAVAVGGAGGEFIYFQF